MKYRLLSVLACGILLTGCSSNVKTDPYQGQNAAVIYAKGHTFLQKGDYTDAITAYQSLDSQYPFESYSQKGDLEIIYAYYQDDQPTLAIAAADRYIRLYPNGPGLDYAHYLRGVVAFDNGRGFLQRHFPYDMSQHYSSNYISAFNDFKIVIEQFPNSPYAPDARRRMIYLNNEIAQYQLNIAQFYLARKAYVAAVNRAQIVIEHYPTTPAARQALQVMAEAYQGLDLPSLASTAEQVWRYNTTSATNSSLLIPATPIAQPGTANPLSTSVMTNTTAASQQPVQPTPSADSGKSASAATTQPSVSAPSTTRLPAAAAKTSSSAGSANPFQIPAS